MVLMTKDDLTNHQVPEKEVKNWQKAGYKLVGNMPEEKQAEKPAEKLEKKSVNKEDKK